MGEQEKIKRNGARVDEDVVPGFKIQNGCL